MKRIISVILAVLMVAGAFVLTSCGAAKIGVNVKITTSEGKEIASGDISVKGKEPTVADALKAASDEFGLEMAFNDDETRLDSIDKYASKTDGNKTFYWDFSVNGKPSDKLKVSNLTSTIAEGDKIEFIYETYQPSITVVINDGDKEVYNQNVVIDEFDDANNNISLINVLKLIKESDKETKVVFYKDEDGNETNLKTYGELVAGKDEEAGTESSWSFTVDDKDLGKSAAETMLKSDSVVVYTYKTSKIS